MTVEILNADRTSVKFIGRLDTTNSSDCEEALKPLLASDMANVVLDCNELVYLSSSGLRIFLNILKASKAKGGALAIKGMQPEIKDIFSMTGFISMFTFED